MDRGAASTFEMLTNEVVTFLSQLKIQNVTTGVAESIYPGNAQYQVRASWMTGIPIVNYRCISPSGGDWLDVQLWKIDVSHVGVCLYTDWN
jgi:hypothetical protein